MRLEPLVFDLAPEERELVADATALVPLLSANAERADADRRLPAEVVEALGKSGFFRLATPKVYGGVQAGARTVSAVAAEIARGCPSASWVAGVFYAGGLGAWMFPDAVRRRVWGDNPDATVCGAAGVPQPAEAVDGGYRVTGRWSWASGAHHASWALLDLVTPDRAIALVPMSELTIEDTWHMAGMRGTGSDTIVADDVFIPEDQVLSLAKRPGDTGLPTPQGLMASMAAPVLGMGMAVYDHVVATLTGGRALTSAAKRHARAVDAPGVQANVADAAMLIDSAILQAARSARVVDHADRTGEKLSPLVNARIRMDAGFAARQVRAAVDRLLDVGGASRFAETDPAQRIWRDLNTAIRHPAFVVEIERERYARLLLELD